MSEPQSNIEIEDVLSSIRRLVSQDHRRPPVQPRQAEPMAPAAAPVEDAAAAPQMQPEGPAEARVAEVAAPEVTAPEVGAAEPVAEVPAFVLSEALRIDEAPSTEAAQDMPAAAQGAESEEGHAEDAPAQGGDQDAFAEAIPTDTDHTIAADAGQWEQPVGDIFNSDFGQPEVADAAHDADHDAARDEGAVAPEAFEAFAIDDGVSIPAGAAKSDDLGEELSRLEGSIAEMEAAFAAPTPHFEPELGDPFGAATLPESFEAAEWVDADEASFAQAEDYIVEASEVPEAEFRDEEAQARVADLDADLGHEAWAAEAGAMGFSPEDEAERAREASREASLEAAHEGAGFHRLHVSDAEHHVPPHEPRRSTYEDIRDAAALEPEEMLAQGDVGQGGLDGLDEDMLRDLVRDMIRQELQGVLGERITRNVRKLVHREIARALAAENFE